MSGGNKGCAVQHCTLIPRYRVGDPRTGGKYCRSHLPKAIDRTATDEIAVAVWMLERPSGDYLKGFEAGRASAFAEMEDS